MLSLAMLPLAGAGLFAFIAGMIIFALVIGIALWVYTSFAYMAIAKKARQNSPGLAWIPYIGPLIVAYKASKMHWWPWILFVGFLIPVIGWIPLTLLFVYVIIWHWRMFETIHKPGWWAILMIIPIVNLVMIGIAAWSK